ncbi:MAG: hypothetical protein ACR2GY_12935 [Phycisphaerales bacterium]
MSYFWGIIWYFYSLQGSSGLGAWRAGDCEPLNLLAGSDKYNGGGDIHYRQKIEAALILIGCGLAFGLSN